MNTPFKDRPKRVSAAAAAAAAAATIATARLF